jgi:hypothetical protein
MTKAIIIIICSKVFLAFGLTAQTKGMDRELDSLLRVKIRESMQNDKYPLRWEEQEKIIKGYNRKKDSTFLSNLQFKISDASKEEILQDIYNWQEVYITTNKKIDTTWHAVMQHFYGLDRYLAYQFCIKHLMVWKPQPEELGSQEEPPAFNMASFPHAKFIYDHYALTEFLPAITGDREASEADNYYFVYRFFYYLKEKTCRRDPACLEEIHRFVKSYYEVEKDEKANSVFMEALESDQAFRTKSTWLIYGNKGKKNKE